jgi:protein tyrosine phosphatase (PTP) superfamily phosphohydrolase (DUF442 family)
MLTYSLKQFVAILAIATVAIIFRPVAPTDTAIAQSNEVPFGDQVGPPVTKYNRLRPNIATAGPLKDGAISELKSLGFATILDLRCSDEGSDVEKKSVEAAGLRYLNIPVTNIIPSDDQVTEFAYIVEDRRNFPLLVHCGSANRVGAMWVLYLVQHRRVAIAFALEEGRTIGMKQDREDAVLKHLGYPILRQ